MDNKNKAASAKNLVEGITDAEFVSDLDQTLTNRKTARRLSALRVLKKVSQAEVAKAMGCTQSKVSKLESSDDDRWTIEDMRSYSKAIGFKTHLGIIPLDLKPTEEVKALTFAIKNRMESLTDLAKCDEEIAVGVSNFFYEIFVNFGSIFTKVADQIPPRADGSKHFECTMVSSSEETDPDVVSLLNGDTATL